MDDPDDIFQWRRRDALTTISGQPSADQLAAIARLGVSHIVNLGLHDHPRALPDEAASVAALGMTYVHIPVDFDAPGEADFDRFRRVIDALGDATVHIHCIANLRVTAFLYRYDRDVLGRSELDARAAMETVWRPGGAWARFVGDDAAAGRAHLYAGRDY